MLSLDQNTAKLKNTTIKDHHNQVTEQKKAKKKKKNNRKAHKDDIWEAGDATERERIREFWINLGEEERKALVKLEKDSVLKKMKEQQKQNCSCSVCGRRRTTIESQLELLYNTYYEELENITKLANNPASNQKSTGDRRIVPKKEELPPLLSDNETDDLDEYDHYFDSDDFRSESDEGINEFGTSLEVKGTVLTNSGGILTVADDFLKNRAKDFLDLMEQMGKKRVVPMNERDYNSSEDEWEDEMGSNAESEEYHMSEHQRMEEGKRMFQIYAAKMFEQRVMNAYREKAAADRAAKLIEELEEDEYKKKQKEENKIKKVVKEKERQRAIQQKLEEERLAAERKRQESEERKKRRQEQLLKEKIAQEEAAKAELERKEAKYREKKLKRQRVLEERRLKKEQEDKLAAEQAEVEIMATAAELKSAQSSAPASPSTGDEIKVIQGLVLEVKSQSSDKSPSPTIPTTGTKKNRKEKRKLVEPRKENSSSTSENSRNSSPQIAPNSANLEESLGPTPPATEEIDQLARFSERLSISQSQFNIPDNHPGHSLAPSVKQFFDLTSGNPVIPPGIHMQIPQQQHINNLQPHLPPQQMSNPQHLPNLQMNNPQQQMNNHHHLHNQRQQFQQRPAVSKLGVPLQQIPGSFKQEWQDRSPLVNGPNLTYSKQESSIIPVNNLNYNRSGIDQSWNNSKESDSRWVNNIKVRLKQANVGNSQWSEPNSNWDESPSTWDDQPIWRSSNQPKPTWSDPSFTTPPTQSKIQQYFHNYNDILKLQGEDEFNHIQEDIKRAELVPSIGGLVGPPGLGKMDRGPFVDNIGYENRGFSQWN